MSVGDGDVFETNPRISATNAHELLVIIYLINSAHFNPTNTKSFNTEPDSSSVLSYFSSFNS